MLNVIWPPLMTLYPHDHRMWAAIGIYSGREDNAFYRRNKGSLVPSGGRSLTERAVLLLGADVIHSVHNPAALSYTGAIHVYGGDFVGTPRSQWDSDTLTEGPYDLGAVRQELTAPNAHFAPPEAIVGYRGRAPLRSTAEPVAVVAEDVTGRALLGPGCDPPR